MAHIAEHLSVAELGRRARTSEEVWHTEPGLRVPDSLRLVYLPPYTPELQPAEHLWRLVDEPIVNQHFDRLAEIQDRIEQRCRDLEAQPDTVRDNTFFRWWPQPARPN